MSSDDSQIRAESAPRAGSKKRRTQRACDVCRHKKVRCDGAQMPGGVCSNCIVFNLECTRTEPPKKRGPKGYVELLEQKLTKLEALMMELHPEMDLAKELQIPSAERTLSSSATPPNLIKFTEGASDSEDDLQYISMMQSIKTLAVSHARERHFGPSSALYFMKVVRAVKLEHLGKEGLEEPPDRKREIFWDARPWELSMNEAGPAFFTFPADDLLSALLEIYFTRINPFFPLLHRPSFERSVASGLHYHDNLFGAVLMLVCAVASRYSSDPRVFLDDINEEQSCGYRYFSQVHLIHKTMMPAPPSLYELQYYCLAFLYLFGASITQGCWTIVGVGMRIALDRGVHRRKEPDHKWTAEEELWKRAFWMLISFDRTLSSLLGRPLAINDVDFDAEYCIECEDEYWPGEPLTTANPALAWKHPSTNEPPIVAYFNAHLRLREIESFMLRSLYSLNKSKEIDKARDDQWRENVLRKLDDALSNWMTSLPEHLRWDPARIDTLFFEQSAALYILYHHIQIQVHRYSYGPKSLSVPLTTLDLTRLALCANAARATTHIASCQSKRTVLFLPHIQVSLYAAGIFLSLNILSARQTGLSIDTDAEMHNVAQCMDILGVYERRWYLAGRFVDGLYNLANMPTKSSPQLAASLKRNRAHGRTTVSNPVEYPSQHEVNPTTKESQKSAQARRIDHAKYSSDFSYTGPQVISSVTNNIPRSDIASVSFDEILYDHSFSAFSNSNLPPQEAYTVSVTRDPQPQQYHAAIAPFQSSNWEQDTYPFRLNDWNDVPNISKPRNNLH